VIRTRVGYAGGSKENPTYHSLGNHAETIEIDYDPTRISYAELLDVFVESHDVTARPWSRQYASIVFYHDEAQRRLAEEVLAREATRRGRPVTTEVVAYERFYLAEDYHQKYRLRSRPEFLAEFQAIYPEEADFVDSTAVARVNGYVAGYGGLAALRAEIDDLGLSPAAGQKLLELVAARER
jgi:peptide-methionine (S)-S-oxide reductase